MKLDNCYDQFMLSMEGVKSPETIRWYQVKLKPFCDRLGDQEVDQVDLNVLRNWRAWLASRDHLWEDHPSRPTVIRHLSMDTVADHVRAVKRLFNWLIEEGKLSNNPAARLEAPPTKLRRRKGISPSDRDAMLREAKSKRDYAILLILCDSSCRVGGLADMRLDDLDLENRRANVREKGRGGHGKERVIFFIPQTVKAIQDYLAERPTVKDDHLMLGFKRGGAERGWKPLTESGIYQVLKRIARRAKVMKNYNPHAFRHGSIRGFMINGGSLAEASQIAGHSSVKTTGDIYGGFNDEELQRAHDRYSWMN